MSGYDFFLNHLFTKKATVGELQLPFLDGVAGDIVMTDGSGILSVTTPLYVVGPASSLDRALPVFDGITGKLIASTTATISPEGLMTVGSLKVGDVNIPSVDGTAGFIVATDGFGTLGFVNPLEHIHSIETSSLLGSVSAPYTTNVADSDHIKFDVLDDGGIGIQLDVTTAYVTTNNAASIGRITLTATHKYKLEANITQYALTTHAGTFSLQWFDVDANIAIGNIFNVKGLGQDGNITYGNVIVIATVSPVTNVRVELRILSADGLFSIGPCSLEIVER